MKTVARALVFPLAAAAVSSRLVSSIRGTSLQVPAACLVMKPCEQNDCRGRREVCVCAPECQCSSGGGGGCGGDGGAWGEGSSEAAEHRLWSRLCNAANVRPSHEMRPSLPGVSLAGCHFFFTAAATLSCWGSSRCTAGVSVAGGGRTANIADKE